MQKVLVSTGAPKDYDPTKHKWAMAIDANRCIGCGLCAEACKKENNVPDTFIANIDEQCEGKYIKLAVQPDGTFTVTNSRNNYSKTYNPS